MWWALAAVALVLWGIAVIWAPGSAPPVHLLLVLAILLTLIGLLRPDEAEHWR